MQPFLVAKGWIFRDAQVSKKNKLIAKLRTDPRDFTWSEAVTLMRSCGFALHHKKGSARMFVHLTKRVKLRLHEPHPQKTLLPYMVAQLLEGLRAAGEIDQ